MAEKRSFDTLTYHRADGTDITFGPSASDYKPVNQPIKRVLLDRGKPDGSLGEWVELKDAPAPPRVEPAPYLRNVRKAAVVNGRRGDGITFDGTKAPVTIKDELIDGYEQNIVVKDAGLVLVRKTVSVNAHAANPHPTHFQGQGLYVNDAKGVTLSESAFLGNGRPFGQPAFVPYGYQHGVYLNYRSGPADAEYCVFGHNAGAGAQPRAGGRFYRCVFTENSIGLLAVFGDVLVEECLFYGGLHYFHGENMAGNMAASAYAKVTLRNNRFVGRPGQAGLGNKERPKRYDMGMICGGDEYEHEGIESPGASYVLEGNRERGWPGKLMGGNKPPTTAQLAQGVAPVPGGPVLLPELDVTPLLSPGANVRAWVERALEAGRRAC